LATRGTIGVAPEAFGDVRRMKRSVAKEDTMMREIQRAPTWRTCVRAGLACALAVLVLFAIPAREPAFAAPQQPDQRAFASPEDAVAALVAAVRANDRLAVTAVIGDALSQLASGDEVQDNLALLTFSKRLLARVEIVKTDETTAVLYTGPENTLFRLPLVKGARGWYFDVEAGKQQILEQRIGQFESRALALCRLYVKAQRQYASADRDGDNVLEFAQRFLSAPGAQDGLYWPNNDMTPESPFGPLVSLAKAQGYSERHARPQAFEGYYYRILLRQGPSAPGGIKEYVLANGNMTEGFGVVAYPARWGASGILTFMVGPDGKVLEKNLGQTTGLYASAISEYNPDETWAEVKR
jgi:hypothetical protein